MVVELKSCCCCISLRTGTIIIAILGLLSGITFVIEGIFKSDATGGHSNSTMVSDMDTGMITTLQPEFIQAAANATGKDTEEVKGEHGFKVSQAIYGFVEIITSALLLFGAIKNSAKFIFPWIFVNVILCILGICIFLGIGILIGVAGEWAFGLTYIAFSLILTVFHIYFILVVNSFHRTLKAGPVSRA